jgi:acyl dehydratase
MAVRELRGSPSLLPLFARAGLAMIPGASNLPIVGGGGGRELPDLTLVLNHVAIDRDRLAAYDRVCGFAVGNRLPATYLHILAFPLQLALISDPSFPFAPIGLVHIANRIVQHRPVLVSETLSLKVYVGALAPHRRGVQFSLHSKARVGDELVWEEVSTNLRRGVDGSDAAAGPDLPSVEDLPTIATWKLPGDLGRRYGSVSGDLNPIHLHSLTARLFGFRAAIAHGMWTMARCLAALEPELPDAFTVEVAFRRPILLPARVEFAEAEADGGVICFGVRDAPDRTPHLDGRLTFG